MATTAPTSTPQWILSNPPTGHTTTTGPSPTFSLTTTPLSPLAPSQVLIKTLYLSNDPAQRSWIQANSDPARMYTKPVLQGDVMRAYGVGEVIESQSAGFAKGDLVLGSLDWSAYVIASEKEVRKIGVDEGAGIRATHFLGALGGTGLTAYYGLVDVVRASKDDVVVVSGAAGATGSMVVQIAKHIVGCKRIVGIAGGAEKCEWVKSLGADECVDYKAASFEQDLLAATDGFADIYFDNVGGDILDLMLTRVKRFGRVAACGAVATYNNLGAGGIKNWSQIITNRIEVRGFIVVDAIEQGKAGAWIAELVGKVKEGKIQIGPETETVVKAKFEDVPKTWMTLFEGANKGKLVTQIEG